MAGTDRGTPNESNNGRQSVTLPLPRIISQDKTSTVQEKDREKVGAREAIRLREKFCVLFATEKFWGSTVI